MKREKHQGAILEKLVRANGYALTSLAKKLHMSRNTLYRQFKKQKLPLNFVVAIGNIMSYNSLPLILEGKIPIANKKAVNATIANDYIELLEKHLMLLELFTQQILIKIQDKELLKEAQQVFKNTSFN